MAALQTYRIHIPSSLFPAGDVADEDSVRQPWECSVCVDAIANTFFAECGHRACRGCTTLLLDQAQAERCCPIDRANIEQEQIIVAAHAIANEFKCRICNEPAGEKSGFDRPVILDCGRPGDAAGGYALRTGHIFHSSCIEEHLRTHPNECPLNELEHAAVPAAPAEAEPVYCGALGADPDAVDDIMAGIQVEELLPRYELDDGVDRFRNRYIPIQRNDHPAPIQYDPPRNEEFELLISIANIASIALIVIGSLFDLPYATIIGFTAVLFIVSSFIGNDGYYAAAAGTACIAISLICIIVEFYIAAQLFFYTGVGMIAVEVLFAIVPLVAECVSECIDNIF